MMPRPSRVIAIARRDLAMELKGRRGLGLPLVMAGLLLPVSGAPPVGLPEPPPPGPIVVTGDVPEAIRDVARVVEGDGGAAFARVDGRVVVSAQFLEPELRAALDASDPSPVRVAYEGRQLPLPGRSMLFALISASTLTGAVSASIGGERQARTLIALLSAAVSRAEVVLGKWAAWTGLGASSALIAALVAIAFGRVDAGWWLLPLVTVPAMAVALSLWLVRRASDVIGGTAVTLRVIPAVVGASGLAAWVAGLDQPLLGAALPLGGALVAAGATWGPGLAPALVATASTGVTTALLLWSTWRDLDESAEAAGPTGGGGLALSLGGAAVVAWWLPLLGPMLWGPAGNETLAAELPRGAGVVAAALGMVLVAAVAQARDVAPVRPVEARPAMLAWALVAGVALGVVGGDPLTPLPEAWAGLQERLHGALVSGWAGPLAAIGTAVATELLFRGRLLTRSGPSWSLAAWVVVCAPLDPLLGLISGVTLRGLAERGGLRLALVARLTWIAVATMVPHPFG